MAASHHDATLNNAASSYTTSVDSTSGKFHSRKGRGPGATAERAAYAEQVHASWFQPGPALLGGRQLRPAESFNHFNPDFIYRYVRCIDLTVGELRELANAVTSTAELHAREQA